MVKIKLSRFGKRDYPVYRIVVSEARSKRDGKHVDMLGTYNPHLTPASITIDQQKYTNWLKKGAQPTETVKKLFTKISGSAQ